MLPGMWELSLLGLVGLGPLMAAVYLAVMLSRRR